MKYLAEVLSKSFILVFDRFFNFRLITVITGKLVTKLYKY